MDTFIIIHNPGLYVSDKGTSSCEMQGPGTSVFKVQDPCINSM